MSSTYLHQTVGVAEAELSIVCLYNSMKMLANTVEMGEPICELIVCWYRRKVKNTHKSIKWITYAASSMVYPRTNSVQWFDPEPCELTNRSLF